MGSAFHQLCPRYSGTLTPTAPTAIRLWETFTFEHQLFVCKLYALDCIRIKRIVPVFAICVNQLKLQSVVQLFIQMENRDVTKGDYKLRTST